MSSRSILVAATILAAVAAGCTEESTPAPDSSGLDLPATLDGVGVTDGGNVSSDGSAKHEDDRCVILSPLAGKQGPLALLIIFPEIQVHASDYLDLARAVQGSSPLALGVGIAKFTAQKPNVAEAKARLLEIPDQARKICSCNLDPRRVLLAGHGAGGTVARDLVGPIGFAGLALLGTALPDLAGAPSLESYPTSLLTLGGELDGLTWVTRIAEESGKQELLAAKLGEQAAAAAKPVVVMSRVNHSQLAAGASTPGDLPAEIPLDEAHRRVAEVVADFLQAQVSPADAAQARGRLEKAVQSTRQLVSAYLEARQLEGEGTWCVPSQESLANLSQQDAGSLDVSHALHEDMTQFLLSKPSLAASGGKVAVKVSAYAAYAQDPTDDSPSLPEATLSLACKMKSQKAIKEKLPQASFGAQRTCADLNALALKWAQDHVGNATRQRFESHGKKLTFIADKTFAGGNQWAPAALELKPSSSQPSVVEVCSPALLTDTSVPLGLGGMHYCKLLSPARAVEWVMVEGLKP
jgi:hypothetical protein